MQIRHGDACNSKYKIANVLERTCFPVGVYVKQIKKLVGVYGERPVFLATDDPQVVKEMRQQLQAIGIELLHADIDRTKYDTTTVLDGRADISGRYYAMRSTFAGCCTSMGACRPVASIYRLPAVIFTKPVLSKSQQCVVVVHCAARWEVSAVNVRYRQAGSWRAGFAARVGGERWFCFQ